MSVTIRQVAELYAATFNRAPDASGLAYWVNDSALEIEEIAMSFFDQPETQALYPTGTTNAAFVASIYTNLFNRAPDVAGLAYWVAELDSGVMTRSVMIEAMKNGAQGTDATIISNKKTVGLAYAAAGLEGTTYSLDGVTADPSTVGVALGNISDLSSPGGIFTLTADASDFIVGTGGNDTITVAEGTLAATDIIVGLAGIDTMNITTTTTPATASINGIENINVNWNATNTATINAANITAATITGTSTKVGFQGNMNVIAAGENRVIAGSGMVGTLTVSGATDGSVVDARYATAVNVVGTGAATVTAGAATTSVTTSGFSRAVIDAGMATNIHITDAGATTNATVLIVDGDATINAATGTIAGSLAITAHDGNDFILNTIGNGLAINGTGNVTMTSNGLSNETVLNNKTSGTLSIIDTSANAVQVLTNIHADVIRLANAGITQVTVSNAQHLETTVANTSITLLDGALAPLATNTVTVTNTAVSQTSIVATAFSTLNLVSNAAAISGTDATYTTLTNAEHIINLSGSNDVVVSNVTAAKFDATALNGNLTYTQASAGTTNVFGSTGTNAIVFKGTTQNNTFTGQNGADSVVFVTTTGHAVANVGEGNNTVAITSSLTGSGSVAVNAGSGNDTVTFGDSTVTGTVTIATGAGTDVLKVGNATNLSGATLSISGIDTIQVAAGHGSTWGASDLSGLTFNLKGVGTLSNGVLSDGLSVVGDVALGQTIDMSHFVLDSTVAAGAGGIYITGNAGNDTITGTGGRDTISGGAGNDTIILSETTAVADTVILNDRASNGVDTVRGFATNAGPDVIKLVAAATTVQTTTDIAALDTVNVALTNGAASYVLGTGIGGLTSSTADIIEINTTLSSFGNLGATGVSNGSELLKALSSTGTAASSITASYGSNFYLVAYQEGNAYLYQVFNNTDTTVSAAEIALVSVFEGVTAGTFSAGDFMTDRYVAPAPPPPAPAPVNMTFTLTLAADTFVGAGGADTFNSTYIDAGTGTFTSADTLTGNGGIDTLNIVPNGVEAITPADAYWTNLTGIEKMVIATTGAGAQTITTGALFEAAFAAGGINLTTTSAGGAITIDMSSIPFSGTTVITTTSTGGAHTITTGSGAATVNATSAAGAITILGANLTSVSATTTGAGAQSITSTGASAVTVSATSDSGATAVITGAGNDTITLYASSAAGLNTVTAGTGADAITLYTNFVSIDTIVQANGASKASTANTTTGVIAAGETITFGTGLDTITNFVGADDVLDVGTIGAAVSGIGLNEAAFTATQTIFFSGAYVGGVFTIALDGAGADTLLLDTTDVADQDIATADTWILLVGTNSGTLIPASFI